MSSSCLTFKAACNLELSRAEQYAGINRNGAISLKYQDVISKKHNKTDYRYQSIAIKLQISQYFQSGISKIHEMS